MNLVFARMRSSRAQATVEFALAFPIFFMLVMFAIQLGLLLTWYGDEVRLTGETARWLSTHSDAVDADVAAHIRTLMWPTMTGGDLTPTRNARRDAAGLTAWNIGHLEARFTPCGAAQSPCSNVERLRPDGTITIEMNYDATAIIFLPGQWRLGSAQLDSPSALAAYRVLVSVE